MWDHLEFDIGESRILLILQLMKAIHQRNEETRGVEGSTAQRLSRTREEGNLTVRLGVRRVHLTDGVGWRWEIYDGALHLYHHVYAVRDPLRPDPAVFQSLQPIKKRRSSPVRLCCSLFLLSSHRQFTAFLSTLVCCLSLSFSSSSLSFYLSLSLSSHRQR